MEKTRFTLYFSSLQDFSDLHVETLNVFCNCLRDSETIEEIQENEGLDKLIELILTSTAPEVHFSALKCITRIAENCKYDSINNFLSSEKNVLTLSVLSPAVCFGRS